MSQTPSTPWKAGDPERRRLSEQKIRYVNNHLTPLAVVIVVPGLIVTPLPLIAAIVGWVLITYSVLINYLTVYLMDRNARFIGSLRVGSNYTVNIILLWLLYAEWPVVWVLLLLMSLGIAVYQHRRDSFLASLAFSMMLLVVHWNFGDNSLWGWSLAVTEVTIMVLLNLFVNGLLQMEAVEGNGQGSGAQEGSPA
ncbi:MAG: hypothetical protein V3T61_02295 [Acidobacteriota bacterium]